VATVNKDFRVKHGIIVADGGTFGSTVTVATPTENAHAATKLYVDSAVGSPTIGTTQPVTPANGNLWFDTVTERIHVYYDGQWIAIATLEDSETLPDHIHDTAIDGTGFVVSRFYDAGFYNTAQATSIIGGFYNSTYTPAEDYDGGSATDNFN
jgi:hypothetical protein